MIATAIEPLDELLREYAPQLGGDFTLYRNHCYRLANLCIAQATAGAEQVEKIAIAAAFHDIGIWTDRTFDYLAPSAALAEAYLASSGKTAWTPEISAMIFNHHKLSSYDEKPEWLVEPFRRADWIDVTRGVLAFGLPRRLIDDLYKIWPDAGFHWRLVQLEFAHLRKHPLNPFPVFRL